MARLGGLNDAGAFCDRTVGDSRMVSTVFAAVYFVVVGMRLLHGLGHDFRFI